MASVNRIVSSWDFSGPSMMLEADIFVSLFYLLGFRLLLTVSEDFPPVSTLLERLIHLDLYLDDGAGCEKDFLLTQRCSNIVRSDLVRAGLVPNCD